MSAPEDNPGGAPPPRFMRLAALAAAGLAVAGGVAFYYATQMSRGTVAAGSYRVAITAKACEPNEITVPAGKRTFEIVNRSDRPVEWEILDGVMVVEERENIAPGFSQTLSARLAAGDYAITCGLLSNPRGVLHVTPSETATADAAKPSLRAFIGPLSEYKVFLAQQGSALVRATEKLAEAVKAGNLEKARALYEPARLPYKRIEPVAYRFADLQNAINPVATYLEKREQDAAFTGFHRIEYGLFAQRSTDGLAPVADKLAADVAALKDRLRGLKLGPADLAETAARMAEQLAQGRLAQGENRYAHTDLADIEANVAGIAKIAGLLKPVIGPAAPDVAAALETRLAAVNDTLAKLKGKDGFPMYDAVDHETRQALSQTFRDLADTLNRINPEIGIG